MTRVKPIVAWQGGKSRLLKHLTPLIRPHVCYVEAFAGGLAMLLAKERSSVEVVNDFNGDLVNLYRCAQFHVDALIQEVRWVLCSRENLSTFIKQPGLTDLQRAARYLMKNRMSFGGGGAHYAVSKLGPAAVSKETIMRLLEAFASRMDKVSVENLSYERLLELYDAPTTLFFLDPPYLNAKNSAYASWTADQMRAFAGIVEELQGDWIVTVDDSRLNRELFARHDIQAVSTKNGCVNNRTKPAAVFGELIIRRRYSARKGIALPVVREPARKKAA